MPKRVRKASFSTPMIVPLPPQYRVEDPRNGVMDGSPYADPNTLTAYSSRKDKFATAHEIGHILDESLTDADRKRFTKILRLKGPWYQGTGTEGGYQSPSEWFADYYAAAATQLDLKHAGVDGYAKIGPKRLRRFKKALDRVGREQGLRQYGTDGNGDALPTAHGPMAAQIAKGL